MKLRKSTPGSNEYKLIISIEAISDIDEILMWYDLHSAGLAKEFYQSLIRGLKHILTFPLSYQKIFHDKRRCKLKKFPISIFYSINKIKTEIVIGAVLHQKRNPEILETRIK
ncbi:MAG: type II toxin-antitoxin system RelE/ParE family toxin [Ignavibacteria bacterium]